MRNLNISVLILLFLTIFSSCKESDVQIDSKVDRTNEAKEYICETMKHGSMEIDISSETGNFEIFTWEKDEFKFEITKRIQGNYEKDQLNKMLKDFKGDIKQNNDKIIFKSYYKGKNKGIYKSIDMNVYMPKNISTMKWSLDSGNIKIHDDIKGYIKARFKAVNLEINRVEGVVDIIGDTCNVSINSGIIKGKSSISNRVGNISVKSEFDASEESCFSTEMGNIIVSVPEGSLTGFKAIGTLRDQRKGEFEYTSFVTLKSDMGEINIKEY